MSPTRRRKTSVVTIVVLAAVVAAGVAVTAWIVARSGGSDTRAAGTGAPSSEAATTGSASATSSAPYTIKPEPTKVASDPPLATTSGQVEVLLTYATFDQPTRTVQASGLVSGVIEDGGSCQLTLTKGSDEVTATSTAAADAKSTTCGLLQTPSGLAAGTWKAVLTYSSASARGTSNTLEVVVP